MLNSYRQEIYDLISQDRLEEKVTKIDVNDGIELSFDSNPQLWIKITETTSHHWFHVEYSKFEKNYPIVSRSSVSFKFARTSLLSWIDNIQKWMDETSFKDPWENKYKKYKLPHQLNNGLNKINFKEGSSFSESEKSLIKEDLEVSKEYAAQLGLPAERLHELSTKLDYLTELVESQNKFNWLKTAREVIMNTVISVATDFETLSKLYNLFGHLFKLPRQFFKT